MPDPTREERTKRIPTVRTVFARWQVECENCGVIDAGLDRSRARELRREHRAWHEAAEDRDLQKALHGDGEGQVCS